MPNRFEGPFSQFVRQRRLFLNLTQEEVADAVGVTPEQITLVEAGKRRLELDRVHLLADRLHVERQMLCRQALWERAPMLYQNLFSAVDDEV